MKPLKKNIYIALYESEIPQNVGAIMRTCACLDVTMIMIEPFGFIFTEKSFRRAKMDYEPEMIFCSSVGEFFKKYSHHRKILFTPHTTNNHEDFIFEDNDILIFGRESDGVEPEIAGKMDHLVSIKMSERCRSLNLAMAVTIGLNTKSLTL